MRLTHTAFQHGTEVTATHQHDLVRVDLPILDDERYVAQALVVHKVSEISDESGGGNVAAHEIQSKVKAQEIIQPITPIIAPKNVETVARNTSHMTEPMTWRPVAVGKVLNNGAPPASVESEFMEVI